jgi:hypothetical protein
MEKITLDYMLNTPTDSKVMQKHIKDLSSIIEQIEELKKDKEKLKDSLYQHFYNRINKQKISEKRSWYYERDKLLINK